MKHKWMGAALSLGLLFLTACGDSGAPSGGSNGENESADSNGEQVELRFAWWGEQTRHDYTLEVIEMYEKENPNVKINPEYANFDDYWKKIAPQAAANELPDIIQMDISYLAQYGEKGQLADLTAYTGDIIDTSAMNENSISGGKVGDKLYGFNLGENVVNFQYNPATLKKIGVEELPEDWTWDDYEEIALKAAEHDLFFDGGMRPEVFFGYYLRTKGESLFNEDGTALGYDDDQHFIDFFSMLQNLVLEGAAPAPDFKAQLKGYGDNPVVKGEGIGIWQWSNQFIALSEVSDEPLAMQHMPGPNREDGLYLKPSMYFSIAESSAHKEEAAKFIDFWVNNIEANKIILGDRGVPVSTEVLEAIKPELPEVKQKVFDYVAWAKDNSSPMDPPDPPGAAELYASLADVTEQMEFGRMSAEDAAKQFRSQAEGILK
ncbi:ABC transporter substrate-binding protein [Aureibacillus halotolerans]|uniref:Multiple sugar transport system substrate-binding protein n=1 Tax=Aureibacillus halotolerans TaxID=1508390 RepID=A0A4R6U785_9BACI|nr:extracellular solute-binding protein [Aureibacillus halotolerans]TDQ42378.1 multiple sugar transport system substrate-binding protein [Aureibacillus halotolerans]